MRVTLESTEKIVDINGVPARCWEGTSEKGIPCIAFVTRIAVKDDEDSSEFERDLEEHEPPSAELAAFPSRMVV